VLSASEGECLGHALEVEAKYHRQCWQRRQEQSDKMDSDSKKKDDETTPALKQKDTEIRHYVVARTTKFPNTPKIKGDGMSELQLRLQEQASKAVNLESALEQKAQEYAVRSLNEPLALWQSLNHEQNLIGQLQKAEAECRKLQIQLKTGDRSTQVKSELERKCDQVKHFHTVLELQQQKLKVRSIQCTEAALLSLISGHSMPCKKTTSLSTRCRLRRLIVTLWKISYVATRTRRVSEQIERLRSWRYSQYNPS